MDKLNKTKDGVLERLVKETASEMGLSTEVVWQVYNRYYKYVRKLMTMHSYKYLTEEKARELAININIPGLGVIAHRFGRKRKHPSIRQKKIKRKPLWLK